MIISKNINVNANFDSVTVFRSKGKENKMIDLQGVKYD